MKPYYEEGGITIYHGDCREVLPQLGQVDAIITDPPYVGLRGGIDLKRIGSQIATRRSASLTIGDPWNASHSWIDEGKRLANRAIIAFCGPDAVSLKNYAQLDGWLLTWFHRNAVPTINNVPHFLAEFIWVFRLGKAHWHALRTVYDIPKINAGCAGSIERIRNIDGLTAAHPTQKPLVLITALFLPEFGTVLDPFAGSGTTLVAAKNLGRKAIGIEIEERYCEIAAKRLSQGVFDFGDKQ